MELTRTIVSACSSDASFRRGEKYYQQGRVQKFTISSERCTATVIGTDEYAVRIELATLEGDCNCYVFDGEHWCKHLVAAGLTVSDGEIKTAETPKVKSSAREVPKHETLEKLLNESGEPALRSALRLVAGRFPDTHRLVEHALNPLQLTDDKLILAAVKQSLQPVRRARSWRALVNAAIIAQGELEQLARDVPASENATRGLLAAAQYVYKQLEQIDDSDGALQTACETMVERAILIASKSPKYEGLLYEALARPSDLPLAAYILDAADKSLRERLVTRLEKHLYKRDQELVGISQDEARYLLADYFAGSGDKRLTNFLAENPLHENSRRGLRVRYHEARGEWQEVAKLLWPLRDDPAFHQLLRRALTETGQHDKLITLQVEDSLHTGDVKRAVLKLRHMLEQYSQLDKLPEIIEKLLKNPYLPLQQKIWLLIEQQRYHEASNVMVEALQKDAGNRQHNPWATKPYEVVDVVTDQNRQLEEADSSQAKRVWHVLFNLEADRVLKANNYDRFKIFGDELLRLGETKTVREMAAVIAEGYPTRKQLVNICDMWLAATKR